MLVVFWNTRMPRETVRTTWDEVEWRKEDLTLNEHPPQCRKWIHRLTWKGWTVQRPVLRWKPRIPCPRLSRWKISSRNFRHHPVCRGYKCGNRCIHGYRCLYRHDAERKPSARPRRRYSRISCYSEKKKSPRLCIRRFWSKEFYSTESWRIGIERFGGTHLKFSGCTWYKVEFLKKKKKVIWWPYSKKKKGEPRERNPCAPDFEDQPPKETNFTTRFFFSKKSVEFGENICSVKAEDNYVPFSCEGARDTEDCMFVLDSGASMHNAEQRRIELRYSGYFEVQKHHMRLTAAGSSASRRESTRLLSGSRPVRNSAITRWNASDSVAW